MRRMPSRLPVLVLASVASVVAAADGPAPVPPLLVEGEAAASAWRQGEAIRARAAARRGT